MKLSQGYNDSIIDLTTTTTRTQPKRADPPPNIIQRLSMATGLFSEVTNSDHHLYNDEEEEYSVEENSNDHNPNHENDDEENQNGNSYNSNSYGKSSGDQTSSSELKRQTRRNLARRLSRKSIGSCCDESPPPVLTNSKNRWEQFQATDLEEESWRQTAAAVASAA